MKPTRILGSFFSRALGLSQPATVAAPQAPDVHEDQWVNKVTGFGTAGDKTMATQFRPGCLLNEKELQWLFYWDSFAAKIVGKIPEEAFRRGYELKSEKNQAAADTLTQFAKDWEINSKIKEAWTWGRLWGGSIVILGANDGVTDLTLPLTPGAVSELKFLNVVDKRYAIPYAYYNDPNQSNYGKVMIYQINAVLGGNPILSPSQGVTTSQLGAVTYIHESRVLRFEGVPVDIQTYRELNGWTYSVLQRPYEILKKFATAVDSTSNLLADASQAVYTLKGLLKQIASGNLAAVQTRMQEIDFSRSTARAVLVDADGEKFERLSTSFQGIPEMLDRYMQLMAAATDIPVSILFGRSAAGMNATGDNDFRGFYDFIASLQDHILTPQLMRVFELTGAVPDDLCVEWLPLWEPSEKEKAETHFNEAQAEKFEADAWAVYIDKQVLYPQEVAMHVFGTHEEIEIDEVALQKSLDAAIELDLNPPEPIDPNAATATQTAPGVKPKKPPQTGAPVPRAKPRV